MSTTTVGRISRDELAARISDVTVIEALSPLHVADMNLPGARSLPPDQVDEIAATMLPDRDATIVVYCANATCGQSTAVAQRLASLGYGDVLVYPGGKQDWFDAGLPVETGPGADIPSIDACCTLPADAFDDRLAHWRAVADAAVDRQRIEGGVELTFDQQTRAPAELAALAEAERSCCTSFRFELTLDGTATRLRITAPDPATVDELLGSPVEAPPNGGCACCS